MKQPVKQKETDPMAKKITLLEKAKKAPRQMRSGVATEEEIELALAWARDNITYSQVQMALKGKVGSMTCYVRLAIALRQYIRNNKL